MKKSCDVLHEQDLPREYHCTKNGSFSFRISSINVTKSQFPVNLVTFTVLLQPVQMRFFQLYQLNYQGNSDILSSFICESINNFIKTSVFPFCLKHADMIPQDKKCIKSLKVNYTPVSILPIYQKYLSEVCISKCQGFFVCPQKMIQ